MNFIRVASQKLFFKDIPPKSKPPLATVVLVHGAGGTHLSWRNQFDALSQRARVIAVDLPGHGLSEGTGEAMISGYSKYIIELIHSLDLQDVIVGGHSMGGAIALDIALRNIKPVKGLLLVGTGARLRVLPAIFTLVREDWKLALQGMTAFMFGPDAPPQLLEEEKHIMENISAEVVLKDFTACDSFDIISDLDSITLPTLIACGKEDRLTPPKYSEFLHDKIEGSQLVLIEQCGHMAMLEKSREFNDCVSSFVMSRHAM
ncbi:MAG: alpha/beta hydrolase [Candidatus Abyssubacteria bacterium]